MKSNHLDYCETFKKSTPLAKIAIVISFYIGTHLAFYLNQFPEAISFAITSMFAMHIITWMFFTAILGPEDIDLQ